MRFRIIKAALLGNKTQKILAFLTIFLASALVCSMLNITLGIGDKVAMELRSYGSNIIILPKGGSVSIDIGGEELNLLHDDAYLEEKYVSGIKNIFWRNNIIAFAPFLEGKTEFENKNVKIIGTYFDKTIELEDDEEFSTGLKTMYPFWSVEGEMPDDDSLEEILVGENLAQEFNLTTESVIMLNGRSLKIKGVLKTNESADDAIITSLKLAGELLNKEGKISWIEVSALTIPEDDLSVKARRNLDSLNAIEHDKWYCSAYVGSIAYQLEEEYPDSTAKALMKISEGESQTVKKIQSLMGVVSILALFSSSIGIASLLSSEIHRRKKEIGLLKALGADNLNIYLLFLAESLITAIAAGIAGAAGGYALSILMAFFIFSHTIKISLIVLPLTVCFAVLIAFLGSLLPMRNVVNLLPAEVLHERK
ncbi:MAG: ABC transporter permease [Campylobacteraceae bacterium]|jgi:putative ABC transport system permease protein|nr:ABC transporter permease [Campylobacteraceae bacterium]